MMEYHFGFTGTQKGLTEEQKKVLRKCLSDFREGVAHHGDCIGADAQFHEIVSELGYRVCIHPPKNQSKQAFCSSTLRYLPKDYMERNQDIVDASRGLFACPGGMEEKIRSGTWATVRRARKAGISILIIWPDGTTTLQ